MGEHSKIEWTDSSWNPIRARNRVAQVGDPGWRTGLPGGKPGWHCEHVSEGCRNCYAESMNRRLGTGLDFKPGHRADVEIFLDEKMLLAPLRWKKPRRIFVNSMTDTFAEFVKDEWIDRMFAVMALCPQHTFQMLTKRPDRMRAYCAAIDAPARVWPLACEMGQPGRALSATLIKFGSPWPLPNVWLGVSAEDQATFEERRQPLRDTPAAVRFFSLEPLLGPIDASAALATGLYHWVIVGGESGPHARPMHPQWCRDIRDQCAAAGVPYFHKQNGEFVGGEIHLDLSFDGGELVQTGRHGRTAITRAHRFDDKTAAVRVGKRAAGRLLDGIEHNGMPT